MKKLSIAIGSVSILFSVAIGAQLAFAPLSLSKTSKVWVDGTSNVRSFSCAAATIQADVAGETTGEPGSAVKSATLVIPVASLDCKNGTMNEHMLKALKAKTNPTIVFRLASYELAKQADVVRVTLAGTLAMGGVEKPVSMTVEASEGASGMLHVVGTHELRMTEWGLKPPTLMLGTMKVDERVKVGFDLLLKD